jgi:hypothetical protein
MHTKWHSKCLLIGLIGLSISLHFCTPSPDMRGLQDLDAEYEAELQKWTVAGSVHRSFDRILLLYATYLSPEFKQSFGSQYISVFGIDPDRVDSDLEVIATSVGRGHEFFIFMDTSKIEWNNLDEKESVWRMALWGAPDQLGVPPKSIQRFKGRGPNMKAFFPYLNDFGRSYYVVFPKNQANGRPILDPEVGTMTIKVASAFGTVDVSWKVEE